MRDLPLHAVTVVMYHMTYERYAVDLAWIAISIRDHAPVAHGALEPGAAARRSSVHATSKPIITLMHGIKHTC